MPSPLRNVSRSRRGLAFLCVSLVVGNTPWPLAADDAPFEFARSVARDEALKGEPPQGDRYAPPVEVPEGLTHAGRSLLGQGYGGEVEPNGTVATASPIVGTNVVLRSNLWPVGDIDFYSFTANAGDKVYASTYTGISAGNSQDSQLSIFASDGTTRLEFDDDNGSIGANFSSSIAGTTIPTTGTYFLRVNDFTAGTTSERPYELHFRLQDGTVPPTPEVEPNNTTATANPLPANGWVSGTRNPAGATEFDFFSLNLNAGDTVFLSLDLDPERDAVNWNGRLGFASFGDTPLVNQILVVDDAGGSEGTGNPIIPSEAMFLTVQTAGTYFVFVDSATAATGGPTLTYQLSVSVHPAVDEGVNCTTYTSTDVPKTIGPGTGLVSSVITVPGNPRIADLDVSLVLNHAGLPDVDAHLRSPAGNDNGLFTDLSLGTGTQTQMDVVLDDEAAFSIGSFPVFRPMVVKPENNTAGNQTINTSGAYRLNWFDGENAGGTWTLDLRDDTANANGGTLTSWSLRICEPPPPPACAPGFEATTVFSTDFESGAAGFTHSGTADEWELGLPATAATTTANPVAAFNTCHSGVNCWKTDLDNTYNASSNQDLLSPAINLAGLSAPVIVSWAQRHQIETATFDRMFVDFRQVGGATPVRLYEWLDPTPISASAGTGSPQANIGGSAGWGLFSRRADSLAGLNTELRFHLDTDSSVQFAGFGVDDVSVTACRALSADLAITKTDGSPTATAGAPLTYTITASNAGPDPVPSASVVDNFPGDINCPTWSCVGAGGGTCTGSGSGSINDTANLPVGGSVTYTANCSVGTNVSGTLSNTATVSGAPIADPNTGDNSATDLDIIVFEPDVSITKTDGVTTAVPGQSVTYTITASNAGPSNAVGATVADDFPSTLTCTWTCAGAGGGTCTAAGSGDINDTVNLPVGGSVTYTAPCDISAGASGVLDNTATVTAAGDPNTTNDSATDTDVLTPTSDLSITKDDGVTTAGPGDTLTYAIVVSNSGPSDALGAGVADTFPAPLTCTWTCTPSAGSTCPASGSGPINEVVNVLVGGTLTFQAVCMVAANVPTGPLANTATTTTANDPNTANNSATDTDTVTGSADIAVSKTVNNPTPTVGSNVTYTVTATNNGPAAATGVQVTDLLPSGLTFVSSTPSNGTYTQATGLWNIGSLGSGASATLALVATVTRPEAIVNQASRTGGNETDPNRSNNTAAVSINGPALADVQVQETVDDDTPSNGQNVTFTVTARNAGPANATGVAITDNLPAGLTFVSATPSQGSYASATGVWTVGAINNGATATLQVVMTVTSTLPTTRVATKTAQTELDVEVSNDSDSVTLNGAGQADLALSMVASQEPAAAGTTFTYSIVVANHGPASATNVTVTDSLPAGLTFVSATASQGTCSGTTSISCPLGTLADGASASIALVVTKTVGGAVSNTADVTATEPDPYMNNNSNGETTTPAVLIDFKVQ
jgi:uncharacterized repeat protein (TIGR01451 family)